MKISVCPLFNQTIQDIIYSTDKISLFSSLFNAIQILGFDYYAYDVRISYPITKPVFSFHNNYSKEWQSRYVEKNYIAIDPIVKHGLNSTQPITWNNDLLTDHSSFESDAFAHGLQLGWTQSSILLANSIGILTLSTEKKGRTPKEIKDIQPFLIWLNNVFKNAFKDKVLLIDLRGPHLLLTAREIETLKWCADGKTSDEIAIILGIKKRTINFHIANAIEKLNVTNKTAATVKALQLNLLV